MRLSLLLLTLFGLILTSCTSTRWIITEEYELDGSATPEILDYKSELLIDKYPTPEDPVIRFTAYEITESQYPLRVKVERSVQQYQPRWGFFLLTAAGATFSFLAANSDIIVPSVSSSQKIALNTAGGILSVLSFMNMQPSGEPIFTGESQLMRQSGTEVLQDTIRTTFSDIDNVTDVIVTYEDDVLFNQGGVEFNNSSIELNLSSFSNPLSGRVNEESDIGIYLMLGDVEFEFMVPISSFLAPFLNVTDAVTLLRTSPATSTVNILTEVGRGSFLEIIEDDFESDDWYKVQYQNTEAYVLKESGVIEWLTTAESGPALVFEFADLPFGEIDVENTVPILKRENPSDRALIISNGIDNQIEQRQYLERDHQLFNHYMTTALQIDSERVNVAFESGEGEIRSFSGFIPGMNSEGSLIVYLSGSATVEEVDGSPEVVLNYENRDGVFSSYLLSDVLLELVNIEPESLIIFVDLNYANRVNGNSGLRNGNNISLNRLANRLISEFPNTAIVFSNRIGQSSNIYTGLIDGNKRHHIFNYFWAEALKQRKSRVADLVRHLENNVDYTSRRLHDTPQEIQAFGNLTINLAQ